MNFEKFKKFWFWIKLYINIYVIGSTQHKVESEQMLSMNRKNQSHAMLYDNPCDLKY